AARRPDRAVRGRAPGAGRTRLAQQSRQPPVLEDAAAGRAGCCVVSYFPQKATVRDVSLHPGTALRDRADLRCRGWTRTLRGVALPVTQYARSGDVNIAYQVVGGVSLDLVWTPSLAHQVELAWESPAHARFLNRLASISRLIVFDKRG